MHIKTDHVSKSVRIEQGVRSFAHGIFGVAFHKSQILHAFHHDACRQVIDIHIRNAWAQCLDALKVHGVLYHVDILLLLCEFPVGRECRGHITAIARRQLCPRINQKQVAGLHLIVIAMIV